MSTPAIQPERILRELDELWSGLGKQDEANEGNAVLRACAMTLIVAEEGHRGEVGETIALLMRDHPCRAIVMRLQEGTAPRLEARVLAQCWMPFGKRQQICCEQIEIAMTRPGFAGALPLLRSLTVADLPVALWCRDGGLCEMREFKPLAGLAHKLILDSQPAADLARQLELIESFVDPDRRVADLAWTRLTRLRETIAQFFDDPALVDQLSQAGKVRIEFQGASVPMSACYVAAWLKHTLGRGLDWEFAPASGSAPSGVRSVALLGGDLDFSVTVQESGAVQARSRFREMSAVFPQPREYDLLREELSLLENDPVYDAVLGIVPEFTGRIPA